MFDIVIGVVAIILTGLQFLSGVRLILNLTGPGGLGVMLTRPNLAGRILNPKNQNLPSPISNNLIKSSNIDLVDGSTNALAQ